MQFHLAASLRRDIYTHDNFTLLGEFDGIADQIDDDLTETSRITNEIVRYVRWDVVIQFQPLFRGTSCECLQRIAKCVAQGETDRLQFEFACFDL